MKVLELEDMLEKERTKLGKLRKAHYQLAVELYGEEEVSNFIRKLSLTIFGNLSILDVWGGCGYASEENVVARAYVASSLLKIKDLSALRNSFLVLPFELPIVNKW